MKLKDIIKKIKNKTNKWRKPDLIEYAKNLWPRYMGDFHETSSISIISNVINQYLNEVFLSKNEGAFWLKSIDSEMQDIRSRLERLEKERRIAKMEMHQLVTISQDPSDYGLNSEEMEILNKMLAEEQDFHHLK